MTMITPLAFTTASLFSYSPPLNGEIPYDRVYPSKTVPLTNVIRQPHHTIIHDLRPLLNAGNANQTSINTTGFQILPKSIAKTTMTETDFLDDDLIRTKYYTETIDLFKKVTGAHRVIIFDHTIRRSPVPGAPEIEDTPETRLPVPFIHVDQTPASGERRVRRHAGEDADELLKHPCSLVNLWRPLRDSPVLDAPLAFADARTLQSTDLVHARLLYGPDQPEGETVQVAFNPDHTWYYLSEMERDEAVLLQCWSNEPEGGVRTPHTGFIDDAYIGKNVEPRHSIEIRALCFFD